MKLNYIIFLLILPIITLGCLYDDISSQPMPERELIRSLTDEEMSIPPGKYQNSVNMDRTALVNLPPPRDKPVIEWSKLLRYHHEVAQIFVDVEGCVWYSEMSFGSPGETLIRLNPDGRIGLKQKFKGFDGVTPLIMCNKAIIIEGRKYGESIDNKALECIDFEGNTLWRTFAFDSDSYRYPIYRLTKNRLILPEGDKYSGKFHIFSIADGEKLDTLTFPEWFSGYDTHAPMELDDGGWLGFKDGKVAKYDESINLQWEYSFGDNLTVDFTEFSTMFPGADPEEEEEFKLDYLHSYPVITPDGLVIIGKTHELVAISLETGEEEWEENFGNTSPLSLTPKGNIIIMGRIRYGFPFKKETKPHEGSRGPHGMFYGNRVACIDSDGNGIWAVSKGDISPFPDSETICYNDGSVLFVSTSGITLVDSEGTILWNMNKDDLGIKDDLSFWGSSLNPAPNGRIVFCYRNSGPLYGTKIVSLGLNKGKSAHFYR